MSTSFQTNACATRPRTNASARGVLIAAAILSLPGCAALGSAMSPYSEKFSCKNSDHGQCVHPEQAYEDAVAGVASRSDPRVTRDRTLLETQRKRTASVQARDAVPTAYGSYRDSVYQELKGLVEAPVTPMLKPARTVRTLVLPYADRQRPDRLYMPRYIYSIVDKPVWVVGGALVTPPSRAAGAPVVGQVQEPAGEAADGVWPTPMEPRK